MQIPADLARDVHTGKLYVCDDLSALARGYLDNAISIGRMVHMLNHIFDAMFWTGFVGTLIMLARSWHVEHQADQEQAE